MAQDPSQQPTNQAAPDQDAPPASSRTEPAAAETVTKIAPAAGPLAPRARGVRAPRPLELGILAAGLAAVVVAMLVSASPGTSAQATVVAPDRSAPAATARAQAFEMPRCAAGDSAGAATDVGDPRARRSAQRGLDYLAGAARDWQARHDCYGCHVQAVTAEALAVGVHHQYSVADAALDDVLRGMLDLRGGARQPGGLGHPASEIAQTSKLLGGAAFARYDQWVSAGLRDFMLIEARAILDMQARDGHVPMPFMSAPVATGPIQATAQAVITWKQAYERTADDQWLTAISRAEDYLHGVVGAWKSAPPASIQDRNYAIMGLLAAGVSSSEAIMVELGHTLASLQNPDGGWALQRGGESEAFATGQALYVLRLMGRGDTDAAVARGTAWLIERQQEDGSWSSSGFGKAEAMWAVLGLVSIDVLSVSVAGIQSGQHVSGRHTLAIHARDNKGNGVVQVELFVDDLRVAGACGASMTHDWDTTGLDSGMHVIEARATNARGEVSRRVLEVYAGPVYLTQIGTRFAGQGTEIALRNIATADAASEVKVEIYSGIEEDGRVTAGDRLYAMAQPGRQGAMTFQWNGEGARAGADGRRFVARLTLSDADGQPVQTEDIVFVHDTPEAQRANWAQLQGQLKMPGGDVAQNAMVELVDKRGNVVQRTTSTREGRYRFRNVDALDGYQVRVSKQGFEAAAPAAAALGAEAEINLDLIAR